MNRTAQYRLGGVVGVVSLTAVAVLVANHPVAQQLVTALPVLSRLEPQTWSGRQLAIAVATSTIVALVAFVPLYRPRPRPILDTLAEAERRVFLTFIALATIGYFDLSFRLPRTTLIAVGGLLSVWLPIWFVSIRLRPTGEGERAIIVGDDPVAIVDVFAETTLEVDGYVTLLSPYRGDGNPLYAPDGGVIAASQLEPGELECIGGLTRLESILAERDIDTVLLAFSTSDRAEFFQTLDICERLGIRAEVHRSHTDSVLIDEASVGNLVKIDLEPWDWQDRLSKRIFDIVFSSAALMMLSPFILLISATIKLDNKGPVLYKQTRSAEFGEPFYVYKFRSMVHGAESDSGAVLSAEDKGDIDPRVTRVGWFLRRTHLDEIPQLWSILRGDMSLVGPRPERPELDSDIAESVGTWRRRWFVKPGLTGLAQVNNVTGFNPKEKLRLDIEYIRKQSFWFDLKIVVRQLWLVGSDVVRTVRDRIVD